MSEWTKKTISQCLDAQWPGEWGTDPNHGSSACIVYRSTELDDSGHLDEEGGVYRSIPANKLNAKALKPGDILLEASGGSPTRPVGRVALFEGTRQESAICANFLRTLRPSPTVSSPFLRWLLMDLHQGSGIWRYQQQTTGMINLKVADYLNHKIDLPPIGHQRRIATILTTLDEEIEATEALIAKHQQIKAGLMHDLFTRGLWTQAELARGDHKGLPCEATAKAGHLRPTPEEAPGLYQDSPIGPIPKTWEPGLLSDCLDPINGIKPGPFGSSLTKDIFTSSGFRVYGQEQVISGNLEIGDYYISAHKFAEMRAFEVLEGDVLLSLVGTIGCVLIVEAPFEPGIINPRLLRLRPFFGKTSPQFVRYLLLTEGIKKQIDGLAGGGTMPVINGKVIRRLRVPMIPFDEQELIVDRLESIEQSLGTTATHLAKLRQQKQGLMHDLLTGRVRVMGSHTKDSQ